MTLICDPGEKNLFPELGSLGSHPRDFPPRPIGHDRESAEAAEDAADGGEGTD